MNAHFLDVLRGLPTLKMFGRSAEQAETIRAVSRRQGSSTMDVLRTAFQTTLVLEWGATAATALVAIETSVRLMAGGLTFERALAVLLLTPEFFLPLRRLSAEYHVGRSAAGGRRSRLRRPRHAGEDPRPDAGRRPPVAGSVGRPVRRRRRDVRRRVADGPGRVLARDPAGPDGRARRPDGRREDDRGQRPPAVRRPRTWARDGRRRTAVRDRPRAAGAPGWRGSRSRRRCSTAPSPTTSAWLGPTPRTTTWWPRRPPPTRTGS